MQPKNWPEGFVYTRQRFSRDIHPFFLSRLFLSEKPEDIQKKSSLVEQNRVHPYLEIQILKEPHPLALQKNHGKSHLQRGVFATEDLLDKIALGVYAGELFFQDTMVLKKDVSMYLWDFSVLGNHFLIDASRYANELAFVNDFRGIANQPNVSHTLLCHEGVFYFGYQTIARVNKGEELLIDYGEKYWVSIEKFK